MSSWLVVGLGNPGPAFASHRHNVGYRVADELARRMGVRFSVSAWLSGRGRRRQNRTARSRGTSAGAGQIAYFHERDRMGVTRLLAYYKLEPAQMIVVHDELDIDPGQLRVKFGGGDNGHNGLRSIRKSLGNGDFFRVRIGVGRPPGRQDPADYLLSNFPASAREAVEVEISRAADAVESLVLVGLDKTQSAFNN